MRKKGFVSTAFLAAVLLAGFVTLTTASAAIRSTTPAVVRVAPPPDVSADRQQSNSAILVFDEQQCVTLAQPLIVNAVAPGRYKAGQFGRHVLPTGTMVSCHLVHFDPVISVRLGGTVTFDEPILGVIGTNRELTASDGVCGIPGIRYGSHPARGLEGGQIDSFTIEAPDRVVVDLIAVSPGDHVRVVTACGGSGSGSEEPPVDCDPPTITPPADVPVECAGPNGTVVPLGVPAAVDRCCDGRPRVTTDAPRSFAPGTTLVTWTATDCRGKSSEATQKVTVRDTTPPRITASANPEALWPPNHRMVPVRVTVTVSDTCSRQPSWILESITSSEPDEAPGEGDGNTRGDIQSVTLGQRDAELRLRAEREGAGPGRVYTATYLARDEAGNEARAAIEVRVPHDGKAAH